MQASPSLFVARQPPETGWLREVSLPQILLACSESRFQGRLHLQRGPQSLSLHLGSGALFLVESINSGQALLAELLRCGALSRDEVAQVQDHARQKQCPESVALLSMRCVPAVDILSALKSTSQQRALDSFAWPDGHYRLETAAAPEGRTSASRIELLELVQEGLSRHWSIERLVEPLWRHLQSFPKTTSRFKAIAQALDTQPGPSCALPTIDGAQPFTTIFHDMMRSPQGAAKLWILDHLEAFEYETQSPRPEKPAPEPHIEIDVGRARKTQLSAHDTASSRSNFAPHPTAETIRQQIEKWATSLDETDHFAVLGITPEASPASVKKAYLRAAKAYHPDRLAGLGLQDLRPMASKVFARMGEAFEVLSDPTARSDYEAMQRGEYSREDAQRAAQAETLFRKAEVLVKMGDFDSAVDFLRPAVDLWGEEPEYQKALGWALFKKRRPEFGPATDHLTRALQLCPGNSEIRERLNTIGLAAKETTGAKPAR
ncbi:MAG: J domain-containing protein [Myxococcota bacterium]|nr:J domain-containing protein [Myxococcota bacterium]